MYPAVWSLHLFVQEGENADYLKNVNNKISSILDKDSAVIMGQH
jgi:hypothetical protein